jgi:LPPG:FO 2-phospho-L-lactate transferase
VKVVALAGGTGSAKLLSSLRQLPIDLTVVANVGDNLWTYGVYVCPDVDIAMYTLAGMADADKGWGIRGDTFKALTQLSRVGVETWFRLGDIDLAFCLARTELMRKGLPLTEATEKVRKSLGVRIPILPVTDAEVETRLDTSRGDVHLQEFWVRDRGRPHVVNVWYKGARNAHLSPLVVSAMSNADRIIICPANPVTSIGPMLAIPGLPRLLSKSKAHIVALSPMVGRAPFSGPAGKLMKATGVRTDSVGVALHYRSFLDAMVISESDPEMCAEIEALGIDCSTTDTRLKGPEDALRLSKVLLQA